MWYIIGEKVYELQNGLNRIVDRNRCVVRWFVVIVLYGELMLMYVLCVKNVLFWKWLY